jgi:hypothetical protein
MVFHFDGGSARELLTEPNASVIVALPLLGKYNKNSTDRALGRNIPLQTDETEKD